MSKYLNKIAIILALVILSSCGMSKSDVESTVKRSFQEQVDTDPTYQKYEMKVLYVTLIETGSNKYEGTITVKIKNNTHNVSITVLADGNNVLWETKPMAFGFLMQYGFGF